MNNHSFVYRKFLFFKIGTKDKLSDCFSGLEFIITQYLEIYVKAGSPFELKQ
jgi:hypothetical protein